MMRAGAKPGRAVAIAVLVTSLVAAPARAADSDLPVSASDPQAASEALFEEGVALADAGRYREACAKFEASQELDAAVGTLLRLADCYEKTGRLASAWARFREARSLAQAQAMPDRERMASQRAVALDAKIQRLTITVAEPVPNGLSVQVGDAPVPRATWGSALPIDAGRLTISASAPGYLPFRKELVIPARDGARVEVEIPELVAELSPPPATRTIIVTSERPDVASRREQPSEPRPDERGSFTRGAGIGFVALGGVGLATAGALSLVSAKRNDASLDHCPRSERWCTPRGVQLRDDARRLADYATACAAIGGAFVVTGVVLYWTAPSTRRAERIALGFSGQGEAGWGLNAVGAF